MTAHAVKHTVSQESKVRSGASGEAEFYSLRKNHRHCSILGMLGVARIPRADCPARLNGPSLKPTAMGEKIHFQKQRVLIVCSQIATEAVDIKSSSEYNHETQSGQILKSFSTIGPKC